MHPVAQAHPPNNRRSDAFGIRHRFVGRHVIGQIVLVDAAEWSHSRAQASARTFTTVAVDFAHAIVIARPFLDTVADARMLRMHAP